MLNELDEMIEKLTPEEKAAAAKELAILDQYAQRCAYSVGVTTLRQAAEDFSNDGETAHNVSFVLYTWRMTHAAVLLDAKRRNLPQSKVLHACLRRFNSCEYINADVITRPGERHVAGGNFVFSFEPRYREVTGIHYPISVHDRVES